MGFPSLKTNNGHLVVIYTTNAGGLYEIHGAYWALDEWVLACWTRDGFKIGFRNPSGLDITKEIHSLKMNSNEKIPEAT